MATRNPPPAQRALSPADVDRIVAHVDGWLGPDEGRLLYRLAAEADPDGSIVEIGSWHGRSTIWLAAGARSGLGSRVVAIDPHIGTHLRDDGESTEDVLRTNLRAAGVDGDVDVVVATSEEAAAAWHTPVSMLWIDGSHDYESARRDLEVWEQHLLPNAAVALHDTFVMPGPERVVRELMVKSRSYTSFTHAETTTAARRCGQLPLWARVRRRVGIVRRSLYGVRLRAYDSNTCGYARIRDAVSRR